MTNQEKLEAAVYDLQQVVRSLNNLLPSLASDSREWIDRAIITACDAMVLVLKTIADISPSNDLSENDSNGEA